MKLLVGIYIAIVVIFILTLLAFFLEDVLFINVKVKKIKDFIDKLPETTLEQVRLQKNDNDFSGVYVLYNINKSRYYVGQGINVFSRVYSHFVGKGNPDVYVDVRDGDHFVIKIISLKVSGYSSLDKLERHAIKAFNSYEEGYNKTRGNGNFYSGLNVYRSKPHKFDIEKTKELLEKYAKGEIEVSYKTFCNFKQRIAPYKTDFPGVYVIQNKTKKMFYVGKSKNIFNAINKQFIGQGNQNIYADWKLGDKLTIKTQSLGYIDSSNLDEEVSRLKIEYSKTMTKY